MRFSAPILLLALAFVQGGCARSLLEMIPYQSHYRPGRVPVRAALRVRGPDFAENLAVSQAIFQDLETNAGFDSVTQASNGTVTDADIVLDVEVLRIEIVSSGSWLGIAGLPLLLFGVPGSSYSYYLDMDVTIRRAHDRFPIRIYQFRRKKSHLSGLYYNPAPRLGSLVSDAGYDLKRILIEDAKTIVELSRLDPKTNSDL